MFEALKLPRHVGIIMDGNGRWATARSLPRLAGHAEGVRVAEEIITHARKLGISFLTLYSFSRENWIRPADEVHGLMELLKEFLKTKKEKMLREQIRLGAIGDLTLLPQDVQDTLKQTIQDTSAGMEMQLTLALSYGGRDEVFRAIKSFLSSGKNLNDLQSEEFIRPYLDTADHPDPDLIIRTGGEHRVSNFLLWQGAYTEYVFDECFWPDFKTEDFNRALLEYQQRERRFGDIKAE